MRTKKKSNIDKKIVLELKNITKLYEGTVALEDVNLKIRKGEVHGLIGKNGAGKSTLVSIISGIISPSKGKILIDDIEYSSLTPIVAKKHNISIITQEPQTIDECTVAENLFMPKYIDNKKIINWKKLEEKAKNILANIGFEIESHIKVHNLSVSEKQLLLVIKSCYVENADIIIMDEVSASLNQNEEKILYGIIDDRIAAGKTVIFISHHTEELLRVCERVTVLRDGRSVASHYSDNLDLESIAKLIIGNNENKLLKIDYDKKSIDHKEVVFELKKFSRHGKFKDIDLKLHKNEIVGIAGLRGSGRTELFKSICGIDVHDKGNIELNGKKVIYKSPAEARKDGIIYLPEEREAEGLIGISSVKKNLTINIIPQISKFGFISNRLENSKAENLMKTLDIKAYSYFQELNQLSGGNKQKVLIGKVLACKPKVCLLDEPTRGVDVEAKESILESIDRELRKDSCILLSTPGIEDLIKISDRILILYSGEIIDEYNKSEFDEHNIYRSMQGEIIENKEVKLI